MSTEVRIVVTSGQKRGIDGERTRETAWALRNFCVSIWVVVTEMSTEVKIFVEPCTYDVCILLR